jgi:hypothetical protein
VAVKGKGENYLASVVDVNGDSIDDLLLHIETENLDPGAIQSGYVVITGTTYSGIVAEGIDEIAIVP